MKVPFVWEDRDFYQHFSVACNKQDGTLRDLAGELNLVGNIVFSSALAGQSKTFFLGKWIAPTDILHEELDKMIERRERRFDLIWHQIQALVADRNNMKVDKATGKGVQQEGADEMNIQNEDTALCSTHETTDETMQGVLETARNQTAMMSNGDVINALKTARNAVDALNSAGSALLGHGSKKNPTNGSNTIMDGILSNNSTLSEIRIIDSPEIRIIDSPVVYSIFENLDSKGIDVSEYLEFLPVFMDEDSSDVSLSDDDSPSSDEIGKIGEEEEDTRDTAARGSKDKTKAEASIQEEFKDAGIDTDVTHVRHYRNGTFLHRLGTITASFNSAISHVSQASHGSPHGSQVVPSKSVVSHSSTSVSGNSVVSQHYSAVSGSLRGTPLQTTTSSRRSLPLPASSQIVSQAFAPLQFEALQQSHGLQQSGSSLFRSANSLTASQQLHQQQESKQRQQHNLRRAKAGAALVMNSLAGAINGSQSAPSAVQTRATANVSTSTSTQIDSDIADEVRKHVPRLLSLSTNKEERSKQVLHELKKEDVKMKATWGKVAKKESSEKSKKEKSKKEKTEEQSKKGNKAKEDAEEAANKAEEEEARKQWKPVADPSVSIDDIIQSARSEIDVYEDILMLNIISLLIEPSTEEFNRRVERGELDVKDVQLRPEENWFPGGGEKFPTTKKLGGGVENGEGEKRFHHRNSAKNVLSKRSLAAPLVSGQDPRFELTILAKEIMSMARELENLAHEAKKRRATTRRQQGLDGELNEGLNGERGGSSLPQSEPSSSLPHQAVLQAVLLPYPGQDDPGQALSASSSAYPLPSPDSEPELSHFPDGFSMQALQEQAHRAAQKLLEVARATSGKTGGASSFTEPETVSKETTSTGTPRVSKDGASRKSKGSKDIVIEGSNKSNSLKETQTIPSALHASIASTLTVGEMSRRIRQAKTTLKEAAVPVLYEKRMILSNIKNNVENRLPLLFHLIKRVRPSMHNVIMKSLELRIPRSLWNESRASDWKRENLNIFGDLMLITGTTKPPNAPATIQDMRNFALDLCSHKHPPA